MTTPEDFLNVEEVQETSQEKVQEKEQQIEIIEHKIVKGSPLSIEVLQEAIEKKVFPSFVKSPEIAIMIFEKARELGLPPVSSLNMFYMAAQGVLSLQANGLAALIRMKGGRYRKVRDFEPVYQTDKPKGFYLEGDLVYDANGSAILLDTVTTLLCTRPDEGHKIEYIVNFKWSEANAMGVLKKDNWVKNLTAMMHARCLSKAAREVYPDIIAGMYMPEELDQNNTLLYDEEGNAI